MDRTLYAKLVLEERHATKSFSRVFVASLKRNSALVMWLLLCSALAVVFLITGSGDPLAWLMIGLVTGRASSFIHNVRGYLKQIQLAHEFIDWKKVEDAAKGGQ